MTSLIARVQGSDAPHQVAAEVVRDLLGVGGDTLAAVECVHAAYRRTHISLADLEVLAQQRCGAERVGAMALLAAAQSFVGLGGNEPEG
jgi:hypothetical protein